MSHSSAAWFRGEQGAIIAVPDRAGVLRGDRGEIALTMVGLPDLARGQGLRAQPPGAVVGQLDGLPIGAVKSPNPCKVG